MARTTAIPSTILALATVSEGVGFLIALVATAKSTSCD